MDSTLLTKDLKSKLDKKQGITLVETLAPEITRTPYDLPQIVLPENSRSRKNGRGTNPQLVAAAGIPCSFAESQSAISLIIGDQNPEH